VLPPAAVDLFSGCGAVTQGFKQAGFKIISAVDNDPTACATYKRNHPEVILIEKDIRKIDPLSLLVTSSKELDLMIVCAPCQPFSSQNKNKIGDTRAGLIFQAVRFAAHLKPTLIFFENVPGFATKSNKNILGKLKNGLEKFGYRLGMPLRVNAADYGVPQRRLRCIVFASRQDAMPAMPDPYTPEASRITVERAIGDLASLSSGERSTSDPLHFARTHLPIAQQRMKHIPKDGGSRFSLPPELELPCHKGHPGHPDVYGRMKWKDVAPTLTTGCTDITRGRFMHPQDNRAITLREAARLQTFPDFYSFCGSSSDIARQIGNAVPINLARAVGSVALASLAKET
jgi:DNA (cytosine-5)-methyltransferase 1